MRLVMVAVIALASVAVAIGSRRAPTASAAVGVAAGVGGARGPVTVSGRKVLDQFGDVYLIRSLASWGLASNLSNSDVASALAGVAANGFNGVTVWVGGGSDFGSSWAPVYGHKATGVSWWSGTPWASSLGAAWSSLDFLVGEAQ